MRICAVIVTYNRLDLLKSTIEKLLNQSLKLDEIIIIDNNCTDGTREYLRDLKEEKVTPVFLDENIGGAGGFNKGIKKAYEKGHDYIWIMDDDTFATETALENMINKIEIIGEDKIGFLCSNVLFKDNKACVMNVPTVKPVWNDYITDGLVRVKNASFVSMLFSRKIVKEFGLPIKDFFIWGDDTEYTLRISEKYECYMCIDSIVHHYMKSNVGVDIINGDTDRVGRYFFEYRNKFYMNKKRGFRGVIFHTKYTIKSILQILLKSKEGKGKKVKVVLKGYFSGITFNPRIEHVK